MPKLRILTVKQIKLNAGNFKHVELPKTGFSIVLNLDNKQESALKDPKLRKALDEVAAKASKNFLLETTKRLQEFDKLFAGMLAKGAPPAGVAKQALKLKRALEKEAPKWEKAAEREVMAKLSALMKKKR